MGYPLEKQTTLISQIKGGDKKAYGKIVEAYQSRLLRFCVFLITDPILAEDLCQEAFMRAYQKIHLLDDPDQFWTWLLKITKNISYRKYKKQTIIPEEVIQGIKLIFEKSHFDKVSEVTDQLMKLKVDERLLLLLIDLEGYTYKEASEIAGGSEASIRSKLNRIRTKFRNSFQK